MSLLDRCRLGPALEGAALDQLRAAPLLEAYIDDVEVLRDDRLREDGARLARHVGPEVATREVREREQPDPRRPSDAGRVERGRVGRLAGAVALAERELARVWAIDPSPEMLAAARAKAPNGVHFKQAHAERLPFKAGWFDVAVLWLVVHLLDRPRAFAELRRVLGPRGKLAIVTFDPAHFDRYWLNGLFLSLEGIDRARFPSEGQLQGELRDAGFAAVPMLRVSQRGALGREEALERIRDRHISTFDLLDEEEVRTGTERAQRELPERIEYPIEWLVAVAKPENRHGG